MRAPSLSTRCELTRCAGKVLNDEKSIESCQIKEKDFLVLMVSKARSHPLEVLRAERLTCFAISLSLLPRLLQARRLSLLLPPHPQLPPRQ